MKGCGKPLTKKFFKKLISMNKPSFISVILARGGSKGIPNKNLRLVNRKPLIYWSIASSLGSKYIAETFVSSDSKDILLCAKDQRANIIKRPVALSQDTTSSADSLEHAVKQISGNFKPEYIVLLQPTSPLRTSRHIDEACRKILKEKTNHLISVCEIEKKYLKVLIESENGLLDDPTNRRFTFSNRQSLPRTYLPNGAIYIVKLKNFLKTKSFLGSSTSFYRMDKRSSIDIDKVSDIRKANIEFIRPNK